ncbi:MAG: RNA polymerase sigma factor [Chloroflexi bacterium]|nr:RNA polymerase sigma factor [Chloroflexota bacterium]
MAIDALTGLSARDQRERVAGWFADYATPVYRYLVRLVGDEEGAADLLQDTFIQALKALGRGSDPVNPSAWLYRIATNLAYNTLRRRRRFRWLPFLGDEPGPGFEGDVALAQSVRQCLAQLKPHEAEALLLHEYAGLTSGEIAAQTNTNPSTVRGRLSRAYAHFAELYQKENR